MTTDTLSFPKEIFSGVWPGGHCQGIAVDTRKEYIYYSYTTMLIKTDLKGNVIGSVTGLLGHLGCIDFCEKDGRVYGSLEYKNDAIGSGILKNLGSSAALDNAFYIAIFDVDKIDRLNMDASAQGVMTSVYLKEVLDDFSAEVTHRGKTIKHRYGCSGIDGITFGKMPGQKNGKDYLFVAYGIYGDAERSDNDYQVILCYDTDDWLAYEEPLKQQALHTSGPAKPFEKLFIYTGNTTYGIQNLEYDAYTGNFLMAVYRGKKPGFPNYALYIVDGSKGATPQLLQGVEPQTTGQVLTLLPSGEQNKTPGWHFDFGSTGLYSFGNGYYYVSHDGRNGEGFYTHVRLYRWNGTKPLALVE